MIVQNEFTLINVPFIQCFILFANINKYASFFFFLQQKTLQQMRNKEKGKHLYLFGQIDSKTLFSI